jgi:hypothetical protein
MPGLPNEFYRRCRQALLKCSEFDNDAALRAVFVTNELYPFRDKLPTAASKSGRVDACLAFLVDKRLSNGRSVLPLFLAALRDRYQEGDALRSELDTLAFIEPVQHTWPIGFDVPVLKDSRLLDPQDIFPFGGILLTDQESGDGGKPPTLYLAVYFKTSQYFWPELSQGGKWLYLQADMRPAFNLRIQVWVRETSALEVMRFLQEDGDGCLLFGALPVIAERLFKPEDFFYPHAMDHLQLWRENGERRMMISTFTATNAGISIHARLSDKAVTALASYLEKTDFIT